MSGRVPILAVGQALLPTGYARLTVEILRHLDSRFEPHQLGINYRGPQLHEPWEIHPNETEGDPHGVTCLRRLLRELAPAVVLLVGDASIYPPLRRAFAEAAAPKPRVVLYTAIENSRLEAERMALIAGVDRLVLYHDEARSWIEDGFTRIGCPPPPLSVIPLGLDTSRFHVLAGGRAAARRALFPDRPELNDAFIVLNANRNTPRKRIDITLEAFARFASCKPDVWLYLHTGMCDLGIVIPELARKLGITDRLLLSTSSDKHPCMDDERMNLIYNACDAGLNTSMSEGWGLPAFEHAATGAAQILPAHSANAILWNGFAELVPVENDMAGPEEFAAALERLYRNPQRLADSSARAHARAHEKQWQWPRIGRRWSELFEEEGLPRAAGAVPSSRFQTERVFRGLPLRIP